MSKIDKTVRVPVEPTEGMIYAGDAAICDVVPDTIIDHTTPAQRCYQAMLAAAPATEQENDQPSEKWWMIYFDDADRRPEIFTDEGCARKRYEQISVSWNAHLFKRVHSNSRDYDQCHGAHPENAKQANESAGGQAARSQSIDDGQARSGDDDSYTAPESSPARPADLPELPLTCKLEVRTPKKGGDCHRQRNESDKTADDSVKGAAHPENADLPELPLTAEDLVDEHPTCGCLDCLTIRQAILAIDLRERLVDALIQLEEARNDLIPPVPRSFVIEKLVSRAESAERELVDVRMKQGEVDTWRRVAERLQRQLTGVTRERDELKEYNERLWKNGNDINARLAKRIAELEGRKP